MTKKWNLMLVLVLALTMALTACGGAKNKEANTPAATNNSANTGETTNTPAEPVGEEASGLIKATDPSLSPALANDRKDTMIIGMTDPKGVFSPLFMETAYDYYVNYSIFNTLVAFKADGTYENSLAEKVDVSEDGLKYTYHLKSGVTFSDGTPLTAKDYLFTMKLYHDATYDGESDVLSAHIVGGQEYHDGTSSDISGIKVIDDNTVEVTVSEYSALTPVDLGYVYIMSEAYYGKDYKQGNLESVKALNSKPMGSGQYKLVSYKAGQEIVLEANENYFNGAPKIKNLIYKTTTESTNMAMLESGEIDMNEINVSEDNVEALKALASWTLTCCQTMVMDTLHLTIIVRNSKIKKFVKHLLTV